MYGKHFESMYYGSMYGAGCAAFAVWGYVIAHMRYGTVELNPRKLADTLGGTVQEIEEAIEFHLKPDPQSRHKDHDGRRMIREAEFQYHIPSWKHYEALRSEEDRRQQNRESASRYRAKLAAEKRTSKAQAQPNLAAIAPPAAQPAKKPEIQVADRYNPAPEKPPLMPHEQRDRDTLRMLLERTSSQTNDGE